MPCQADLLTGEQNAAELDQLQAETAADHDVFAHPGRAFILPALGASCAALLSTSCPVCLRALDAARFKPKKGLGFFFATCLGGTPAQNAASGVVTPQNHKITE